MSFSRFNPDDTVLDSSNVISSLWTGNANILVSGSFYTSSVQEVSTDGAFYLNVSNLPVGNSGSQVQFAIAYGHVSGSGSAPFNTQLPGATPTRNIYGQYRSLIYGDENAAFTFGMVSGSSRDIYVLNINRSRYKESLNPGSLNLSLKVGSDTLYLTDNSNDVSTTTFIGATRVFNIVSGSSGRSYNSSSVQTASGSYGLFFPDLGTIILNPRALALSTANGGIGITVDETASTSYAYSYNMNNSNMFAAVMNGANFQLQSLEKVNAKYMFARVKNQEFNYTTNPSIIDDKGNLLFVSLVDNPETFFTTVGLYNDKNELLAVAKLSKPLRKNFTSEATLRIKLDF